MFPFVFLFLQVRCGRCKAEQQYELDINIFLDLLISMVAPILIVLAAMYVVFFTGGINWQMFLVLLALYVTIRCIKLVFLMRKYQNNTSTP